MKKIIALALLAVMLLTLAACGAPAEAGPEGAIVGTWKAEDGKEMTFKTDGTGTAYTSNGLSVECKWTYIADSSEFELQSMPFGKIKITIAEDKLTWFDIEYTKAAE